MASQSLISFDMLEQIATIVWAQSGDSKIAENLAAAKLMNELWQRLSGEKDINALRTRAIENISRYVKDHPRATKDELTREIQKQITEFSKSIEEL